MITDKDFPWFRSQYGYVSRFMVGIYLENPTKQVRFRLAVMVEAIKPADAIMKATLMSSEYLMKMILDGYYCYNTVIEAYDLGKHTPQVVAEASK